MNPKKWIVNNVFPKYRKLRFELVENPQYLKRIRAKYQFVEGVRNIYIVGTPNHCNLGDYAIGYAEERLFKRLYPNDNVYSINMTEFGQDIDGIKTYASKEDIFILTGGGNLGNVYMDDENIRRRVITMFPDNRIILFPQTMQFTNDEDGIKEQNKTKGIYNEHKYLTLTAREETSQKLMETLFERKVFLLPDVVMTLEKCGTETIRDGAYLCLRNDLEGVLSKEDKAQICETLKKKFSYVGEFDTVKDEIDTRRFKRQFMDLLEEFKSSELVITDRLHGMILAAVTGTPCFVLSNYNHKVKGCYEWLKGLENIILFNDIKELENTLNSFDFNREYTYDNKEFEDRFIALMGEVVNG